MALSEERKAAQAPSVAIDYQFNSISIFSFSFLGSLTFALQLFFARNDIRYAQRWARHLHEPRYCVDSRNVRELFPLTVAHLYCFTFAVGVH